MFWREAPKIFEHFWLICKAKSLMFWREAPENFDYFWLICKAKSLMFCAQRQKNWHFQKNYNLGRQDFKKNNLGRKIPEFWVPVIVKGGL